MKGFLLAFELMLLLLPGITPTADTGILEDWESIEELASFLEKDDTDSHIVLVAGKDGVVRFNNQCEDRAIQLRDRAMQQGKYLALVPLHRNEYHKWYGKWIKPDHYHMICGAVIGEEFYYVEPSDDKVWLALHFD